MNNLKTSENRLLNGITRSMSSRSNGACQASLLGSSFNMNRVSPNGSDNGLDDDVTACCAFQAPWRNGSTSAPSKKPPVVPPDKSSSILKGICMRDLPQQQGLSSLPTLLTVDEAASLLRTSRKAIYAMVERCQIPGVVRIRRRVLFRAADLLHWLDQKCAPSPKE